ncbi:glycosyltransferase family 2 protein [Nocardioides sp. Leaf307]|uniref:glycosyltransferase family 2 protein n=1 Tax=Nocardioides sp. Leaf307 TaxID=1736331 RepID=UPI000713AC16|nr:glycosyltransferase family 2 protein [Nocardioides sp. Leaf307]KQQ43422.1 hypothetical protein ASF50_05625 [Nocardioides sp. Leaf307]
MPASESPAVVALVVSHDGARWLPAVVDGVTGQTRPVDRVVAVDTTSRDDSVALLEAAFGPVHVVPGSTSYPAAVREGLARVDAGPHGAPGTAPDDWVWLLHDDANPDPGALEALLAAAAEHPEAAVLGPKLREWPSLRRLLEVGATISGTGRRETGLERGEYDQGQHDQVRRVLAVNTAGMLVRRSALDEVGGFDEHLPIFGNDLDFGWRAAAAGHHTLVVPSAVVFHAEAAHRGLRRTPLTGRHTHYQERRAALWTLLVNSDHRLWPLQALRLALGTLLRVVGFLLVRAVGEALDELAALVNIAARPRAVLAARRERREARTAPSEEVRGLLAPRWLPYRHGLDAVSDLLAAATDQAADVAERRRAAAAELDPASFAARRPAEDDEDAPYADTGVVARFVTNPVAIVLTLVVLLAVVGAREAFGSVVGGALSPVPDAVGSWWRLHTESWHAIGQGTAVPAPPYVAPLALLGGLLLGSPAAALSAVLVLAVPVALWGSWRFLRVVGRLVSPRGMPRWLLLWGSTAFALVPVASGAWGAGRLGPVVAAALLPWLAHAALGFADPAPDRRWRAAWRSGLLLALVTAFGPAAWLFAAVLGVVVLLCAALLLRAVVRDRSVWGPPVTALLVPVVLLSPWWVGALGEGAGAGLLLEPGRLPHAALGGLDLLAGRVSDLGAPVALGLVPAVLAVLALVPRATRVPVLVCWLAAAVAALLALGLSSVSFALAATSTPAGLGALVVLLQGALVTATVLGAMGAWESARREARGLLRGGVLVGAALAGLVPLATLGWFVAGPDDALADSVDDDIPAYMVQRAELGPEHGILVLRGDVSQGLTYSVVRGDGTTLGEDEVLALGGGDGSLAADVRELTARPTPAVVDALAGEGIEYVVLPSPADGDVAADLDATGGLVQASAEDRSTRAWRVARELDPAALDGPRSWLHVALLGVQLLGAVAVVVLGAPTRERRRAR